MRICYPHVRIWNINNRSYNVEVSCWRKHEQDIRWMGAKVKRFRLFYYSNGISAMTGKVGVKVK